MKKITIFAATLVALALTGCQKEVATGGSGAIEFRSSIGAHTRATDTAWEQDDQIGVFMLSGGEFISENVLEPSNVLYTTDGSGNFSSETPLVYPADGASVYFAAYYPHQPGMSGFEYSVDVTDQSDPAKIDLLLAKSAAGYTEGTPTLRFNHKLTKLVFRVTDGDDATGASLESMVTTFNGLNSTGIYNISTQTLGSTTGSGTLPFAARLVDVEDGTATVEAIVLPETSTFTVTFTLDGGTTASVTLEDKDYQQDRKYTYTVNLKSEEPESVAEIDGDEDISDWGEGDDEDLGDIEKDGDEEPVDPGFEVVGDLTPAAMSAEGGTLTIDYTIENEIEDANVTVVIPTEAQSWISLSEGPEARRTRAAVEASISLAIAENTGAARAADVTLTYGTATQTITVSQAAGEPAAKLLFPGSDFETTPSGMTGKFTTVTPGLGRTGGALVWNGTNTSNADGTKFTVPNITATSISFWIKGTSDLRGICVAFNGNNSGNIAVLGACGSDTTISSYITNANYSTAINTNGQWVKVTLTNIPVSPITALSIRAGGTSGVSYDLVIDDITYE